LTNPDYQKLLDAAILALQDDDEINFDVLINEQLLQFYEMQP
jgi:hypothetical protein